MKRTSLHLGLLLLTWIASTSARVEALDPRPKWSVSVGLDSFAALQGVVVSATGRVHLRGYLPRRQNQPVLRTYDPSDGALLWEYVSPPLLGGSPETSLLVGDDGTVVTWLGYHVLAFDAVSGNLRWATEDFGGYAEQLALGIDGSIFMAHGRRLLKIDPRTGQARGSHTAAGLFESPPVVGPNGLIYYGAYFGDSVNGVWSVDPATGNTVAHFRNLDRIIAGPIGPSSLLPLSSGDLFVAHVKYFTVDSGLTRPFGQIAGRVSTTADPIESTDGMVFASVGNPAGTTAFLGAYNPVTGARVWQSSVTDPTTAALSADGTLYAAAHAPGQTPILHAVEASTGRALWSAVLRDTRAHAPILSPDGTLYVRTTGEPSGGTLHAFAVGHPPAQGVWAMEFGDSRGTSRHPSGLRAETVVLTAEPRDLVVEQGTKATFGVIARGTAPFSYQWFRDGLPIPGATLASLTIPKANDSSTGGYSVEVRDPGQHRVMSRTATLSTLAEGHFRILITRQPESRVITAGTNTTFLAEAHGAAPLSYQWSKDSRPIEGANQPSLTLSHAGPLDEGTYTVTVSNLLHPPVVSQPAVLTVLVPEPLAITRQPRDVYTTFGSTVSFTVESTGSPLRQYTWNRNGFPVPRLSEATRTIPFVSEADLGTYTVAISTPTGSIVSRPVTLSFGAPPARVQFFQSSLVVTDATGPDTSPGDVAGPAAAARFSSPNGGFVAPNGDVLLADTENHRIKRLTRDGQVLVVAGSGQPGSANGPAATSTFRNPVGVTAGPDGTIYVADFGNHMIRRISTDGLVSTLAGNGEPGLVDGPGALARFNQPNDLVLDSEGLLYVTEFGNHTIRRVSAVGDVVTWVGYGIAGSALGHRRNAQLDQPAGIAIDAEGNLFVTEWGKPRIRKVSTTGTVSNHAGTGVAGYLDGPADGAEFSEPDGIAIDSAGNLFITDRGNHVVRRISALGLVQTVAGKGSPGSESGPAGSARFDDPSGLGIGPNGDLFVTDTSNHRVRRISLAASISDYRVQVMADAPTSVWPLSSAAEAAGGTLLTPDIRGRHPGTCFGTLRWTTESAIASALPDSAYLLITKGNQYVDVPAHADFETSAHSIEVWARIDSDAPGTFIECVIASSLDGTGNRGWILRAGAPGEWEWAIGNGQRWTVLRGPQVRPHEWTHLVATVDQGRARFFVNGVAVAGRNLPFASTFAGPLRFGPAAPQPMYQGALDEIAVYPTALSPERVLAHYAAGTRPDQLTARLVGGRPMLAWFRGVLQSAPTAAGPWADVPHALSPLPQDASQPQTFFRTRAP